MLQLNGCAIYIYIAHCKNWRLYLTHKNVISVASEFILFQAVPHMLPWFRITSYFQASFLAKHELGCKWNSFCNCIFVPKRGWNLIHSCIIRWTKYSCTIERVSYYYVPFWAQQPIISHLHEPFMQVTFLTSISLMSGLVHYHSTSPKASNS